MAVRLFVGNLPYDVTEAELRESFSSVGELTYVYLPIDRESGKPRGFAFLEFSDRAQAEEAIRRFNSQLFRGRTLAVNEARAREDRRSESPPRRPPSAADAGSSPLSDPESAPRSAKPGRSFGPDATPRRTRGKGKAGPKSERAPKGPMREVIRGQFFGGLDDDTYDEEQDEENFASRVNDDELEAEG